MRRPLLSIETAGDIAVNIADFRRHIPAAG
jgi:hypothetical protein